MTVKDGEPREDDLTVIPGIGPVIARRLRAVGIRGFEDLAALDPARVAGLLSGMPTVTERTIRRADWVGRARWLAGGEDYHLVDAGYESFVVRVYVRRADVSPRVRLQRVSSGEVRHLPDLAAAFRAIGAHVATVTPGSAWSTSARASRRDPGAGES